MGGEREMKSEGIRNAHRKKMTPAMEARAKVLSSKFFHSGERAMWECADCVAAVKRADADALVMECIVEFRYRSG